MISIEALLARSNALSLAAGWSIATVSVRLFGDGTRLPALIAGKDMGLRRIEKVLPILESLERQHGLATPPSADAPRSDDHGGLTPSESHAAEHPLAGSDGVTSTLGLGRSRSEDMPDTSHAAAHNSPPILIGNLEHQTGECAEVAR